MGEQIDGLARDQALEQFTQNLLRDIRALELMLERGLIETGITRIGAEQEICLVNHDREPAPMAMELLEELNDPLIVNEYARFNLEVNLEPQVFRGDCFRLMEHQLNEKLGLIHDACRRHDIDYALVGILPTLRQRDLEDGNMTPLPRYRILNDNLTRLRDNQPFRLSINGADELLTQHESSLLESCNTSFQVHLQVDPDDFVTRYNFAQLLCGPLLAASSNSNLLFGRRLWRETRIALFQQSIDTRKNQHSVREQTPRVSFGTDWLRQSVTEIFKDSLARHRFIMYDQVEDDSLAMVERGEAPKLRALCLFNGTVYPWNRACYGVGGGKPHLRIENRILPSGPTVRDEIANAAFWLGAMMGMPDEYRELPERLSFADCHYNFFKAAKLGLDTQFTWLDGRVVAPSDLILNELLPMAERGLSLMKVDDQDVTTLIETVAKRVEKRHTGSLWMFESFQKLRETGLTRFEICERMTKGMIERQHKGDPIHEWTLVEVGEHGNWRRKYWRVDQIMATDLYTVGERDLIDLAAHIMEWKKVRHIPVENTAGEVVGLIDTPSVLNTLLAKGEQARKLPAAEIMDPAPLMTGPDTSTLETVELMGERGVSCALIVEGKRLLGMVTEHDFTKISAGLLRELESSEEA